MSEQPGPYEQVAMATSRQGFLARVSTALFVLAGAGALVQNANAEYYTNFCGHTWTTGNCPHPTGLPRVDKQGKPLRARDGRPVDDVGRVVDADGHPIDDSGALLLDPDGNPLPLAPRTPICTATGVQYNLKTRLDGSWYRCCGGHVRRLIDCCAPTTKRVNGDAALDGYCHHGRKVFCVVYIDTKVPC